MRQPPTLSRTKQHVNPEDQSQHLLRTPTAGRCRNQSIDVRLGLLELETDRSLHPKLKTIVRLIQQAGEDLSKAELLDCRALQLQESQEQSRQQVPELTRQDACGTGRSYVPILVVTEPVPTLSGLTSGRIGCGVFELIVWVPSRHGALGYQWWLTGLATHNPIWNRDSPTLTPWFGWAERIRTPSQDDPLN